MQVEKMADHRLSLQTNAGEQSVWKQILNYPIGIIPLYAYLPFVILTYVMMADGKLPNDMLGAVTVMVLIGFVLGKIGDLIPVFKNLGGSSILATFFPSFMVAHHWLPKAGITSVTSFMKTSNFLYVYIAVIIVGSILSLNRKVMIKALLKMFVPLLSGTIVSIGVGIGVGKLVGIGVYKTVFFIIAPIMAGGVGEGAVPLSLAYAHILKTPQDTTLAQVLPAVMLGSLSAIILAGLLKRLGEKKPEYSGNGFLVKTGQEELMRLSIREEKPISLKQMAFGGLTAIVFYLFGVWFSTLIGIPGPIIMLFLAVLLKLLGWLPKEVEDGANMIYRFFVVAVTMPLLMGVGVAMTPWNSLIAVLNPAYLITIFATVLSLVVTGFFVGKWMNMYPIESALVTACHSGQGGTGDVAILTASDRLSLMPFAQVSTRIFGAITVTLATILLTSLQ